MLYDYRRCDFCDATFWPKVGNQRYCSTDCATEANRTRARTRSELVTAKKRNTIRMRKCAFCDILFKPKGRANRFCSSECCLAAHERRRWPIFNRDGFRCFYCGKSSFGDTAELHVDHVVPKSKGGEDTAANLVTSCIECNLSKSANRCLNESELLAEIQSRNENAGILPAQVIKLTGQLD